VVKIRLVRRLVFLSAVGVVQALPYAALTPLLPAFEEEFGLSKAQAGLLVGMFPIGQVVTALPVGLLASRVGVKRFALSGLVLFAATSTAFGLVDSYGKLLAASFLQGAAAALCWSSGLAWLVAEAPRQRRSEMIGLFSGAAAAGNMLGPVVGGVAVLVGRAGAFAVVAGLAVLLAIAGAQLPGPASGVRQSVMLARKGHGSLAVLGGQWLVAVPALLLGVIWVLAPLQLNRLGWGPVGIASTFLVSASIGIFARPLIGRWADRLGNLRALRFLLLASIPVTVLIPWVGSKWGLAVCIFCAVTTYGVTHGPAVAFVSHAYDEAGVAHVFGFALVVLVTGLGFFVGSAAGGEIAHIAGDAVTYALAAGTCLLTVAVLTLHPRWAARSTPATRCVESLDA
jgi:MFS family permease